MLDNITLIHYMCIENQGNSSKMQSKSQSKVISGSVISDFFRREEHEDICGLSAAGCADVEAHLSELLPKREAEHLALFDSNACT